MINYIRKRFEHMIEMDMRDYRKLVSPIS